MTRNAEIMMQVLLKFSKVEESESDDFLVFVVFM